MESPEDNSSSPEEKGADAEKEKEKVSSCFRVKKFRSSSLLTWPYLKVFYYLFLKSDIMGIFSVLFHHYK